MNSVDAEMGSDLIRTIQAKCAKMKRLYLRLNLTPNSATTCEFYNTSLSNSSTGFTGAFTLEDVLLFVICLHYNSKDYSINFEDRIEPEIFFPYPYNERKATTPEYENSL